MTVRIEIEYPDGTAAAWETNAKHAQVIESLIIAVIGKPDRIRA